MLNGEVALKGFEIADRGVVRGALIPGDRRISMALRGVVPPEGSDAGVMS
jgi:hypothetical protein